MDAHDDATETALDRAVADELHRPAGVRAPLSVTDLVLQCDEAGVPAAVVLRRALDRVTRQNDDQSAI